MAGCTLSAKLCRRALYFLIARLSFAGFGSFLSSWKWCTMSEVYFVTKPLVDQVERLCVLPL